MRKIFFSVSLIFILFFFGCQPRPKGMPEVVPCAITVLKNGKPLEGIDVALHKLEGNGSLSMMAFTNSQGVAKIHTHLTTYKKSGAPVGNYKITIDKPVKYPEEENHPEYSLKQLEAYLAKREAEIEKLRIIPKKLTHVSTTPFEINVEPQGTEYTIELKDYVK
jgi:5-hydroxyisourate hydrolase-like protein (transthyretin family)